MSHIIVLIKTHSEDTMESIRINISLPKEIFTALSKEVESRKRSQFITEAVKSFIKEKREQISRHPTSAAFVLLDCIPISINISAYSSRTPICPACGHLNFALQ